MPLPTITDCYRVAINYFNTENAMTATNVIHFLAPTGDEDDLFNALNDNVTSDMWEPCTNALGITDVVITKLDGTPDGRVYGTAALTGDWRVPTGSQQFIPQAAALIKLATAATGRSGRGRIYLPFLGEGVDTNGLIDATPQATTTAAWVAFSNAMVADGKALAVASYVNSSASQVLNLTYKRPSATQRRRMKQ